ncbi:2,3-bisphosphoglycerate-dependent phosphoglycerate mutase [Candidatus Lokiarchaeum ossiferum]|uniref:2,3-bisphosphoglycerate-dependent phosphoglycerate mutase n=1 Tax=Candidatus Lokiarchaeum ossiferum TaxID=2951803 RepID=A0ABY6HXS3_9ARCH|nr:2,3-bisphosphoglycerate-dependent phosphoglycerate mutase [Candidatus Lokiarchaeum sp. B-35]
MTIIYLTRHGQTEWNKAHIMQGWQNAPLTDLGKAQAKQLGKKLRPIAFDAVYSSDSDRAYHTAQIITQNQPKTIIKLASLREINLGEWEGKSLQEFEQLNPTQYHNFWNLPHLYVSSAGETFFDVKERVIKTFEGLIQKHRKERLLIVAHTVVVKTILAFVENEPLKNLWVLPYIHPTSLSIIRTDNQTKKIELYGDISHYEDE